MNSTDFNYVRSQFKKLRLDLMQENDGANLKVEGDMGETKWLRVSRDQLRRIEDILAEDQD